MLNVAIDILKHSFCFIFFLYNMFIFNINTNSEVISTAVSFMIICRVSQNSVDVIFVVHEVFFFFFFFLQDTPNIIDRNFIYFCDELHLVFFISDRFIRN